MKTWGVTSRRPHLCQRSDCEGVTAVRALPQRGEGAAAGGRRAGDCGCRAPSLGDAVLGVAAVARPHGGSRVPRQGLLQGACRDEAAEKMSCWSRRYHVPLRGQSRPAPEAHTPRRVSETLGEREGDAGEPSE
jgi:hypothetical protein